jgi:hypothetical protein
VSYIVWCGDDDEYENEYGTVDYNDDESDCGDNDGTVDDDL